MKLSIIIPAYNEAQRISKTLESIDMYLKKHDFDYEILVVTDGAKDNTIEVVENLIPKIKGLRLIINKVNRGKGAVVRQGMMVARGQWRLFMDADNATKIEELDNMWPCTHYFQVLIGSRRIEGASIAIKQPVHKDLLGQLGNKWIQMWATWGIRDTQCGFKMFSDHAAQTIFKRTTLNRWGFDFEIIAIARQHKLPIKEIPVIWRDDPRSHVKGIDYIQVLWEAVKVRFNIWFRRYI
jgi:dolichyl-phosphate beta-glucosyltransferase